MPIVAAGFPALGLQGRMWPQQVCAGFWWVVGAAAAPWVTLTQGCELLLFYCFFWGAVLSHWQRLLV